MFLDIAENQKLLSPCTGQLEQTKEKWFVQKHFSDLKAFESLCLNHLHTEEIVAKNVIHYQFL